MSINKVVISGNLTRDAELRQTASGTAVLSFSVAVNERRPGANGEWEDYANFFDCVMFGSRAEKLAKYLGKGTKIVVDGRLRWSQYQAKDGTNRSRVNVIVDNLEFMAHRNGGENTTEPSPSEYSAPVQPMELYDEDIPF